MERHKEKLIEWAQEDSTVTLCQPNQPLNVKLQYIYKQTEKNSLFFGW